MAIDCGLDEILTEPNYYFHVPQREKYDVIADFSSCTFPHGNLPPVWLSDEVKIPKAEGLPRETSCNSIVLARDVSCRVINSTLGTQGAHLLPKSEELWYTNNYMLQYSAWEERGTPDDPRNAILLRSDIHTLFDAKRFFLVPKEGKWVTHVLYGTAQDELARNFHNVHVQPLRDVSVEFLFARFMYTIHALSGFAHGGGKRSLLVIRSDQTMRERVEVTGSQYKTQLAPRLRAGSRNSSPSKRRRDDAPADSADAADVSDPDSVDDDEVRGRPRRRLSYETTSPSSLGSPKRVASISSSIFTFTNASSDLDHEPADV
ncbi:hypothetical protein EsDP_00003258 [Epichloe bromicola]